MHIFRYFARAQKEKSVKFYKKIAFRRDFSPLNDNFDTITWGNSENLTLSNCSAYNSVGVRCWKRGRTIILAMSVQGLTANTRVQIATLPSGYRPLMDATFYGGGGLSYSNKTIVTVRATGELYVLPDDTYTTGYFMFYAP
ncbi:MAG: hypothetical protein IKQ01_06580 [Bacteroidales bacterium]|nr:hypothetical protein [Bacteroidales bacterium]